jgi:hypothetical protein
MLLGVLTHVYDLGMPIVSVEYLNANIGGNTQ